MEQSDLDILAGFHSEIQEIKESYNGDDTDWKSKLKEWRKLIRKIEKCTLQDEQYHDFLLWCKYMLIGSAREKAAKVAEKIFEEERIERGEKEPSVVNITIYQP